MKTIKPLLLLPFLLIVLLVGCNRGTFTSISALKELESMSIIFDEEMEIELDFENNIDTVFIPEGIDFEARLSFKISDRALLVYDNNIVTSGDKIKVKEAKNMVFSVVAEDETWQDFTLFIYTPSSSAKEVQWVKIQDKEATIEGDKIKLNLPYDTDLSALKLEFLHSGAKASIASGRVIDYSQDKLITIEARDGTKRTYALEIQVERLEVIHFIGVNVERLDSTFSSNFEQGVFTIELPYDVDFVLDKLSLNIDMPSGYKTNFTNGQQIFYEQGKDILIQIVGSDQIPFTYKLRLTKAKKQEVNPDASTEALILSVELNIPPNLDALEGTSTSISDIVAVINHEQSTVRFTFPYRTIIEDIEGLSIPYTLVLSDKATSNKEENIILSFNNETKVTVNAEDRRTFKEYEISFAKAASPLNFVSTFELSIAGQVVGVQIQGDELVAIIPFELDFREVIPTFVLSKDAEATITSGQILQSIELGVPLTFRVTSSSGADREYNLLIEREEPVKAFITELTLVKENQERVFPSSFVLDENTKHIERITFNLPQETDMSMTPFRLNFTLKGKDPKVLFYGEVVAKDIAPVQLHAGENILYVQGQDGLLTETLIFINIESGSDQNNITRFQIANQLEVPFPVEIQESSVTIRVPQNTDLTNLNVDYEVDEFATKLIPDGNIQFKAGESKEFTVIAQSGLRKVYQVKVVEDDSYLKTASRLSGRLVKYSENYEFGSSAGDSFFEKKTYKISYHSNGFVKEIEINIDFQMEKWIYFYDVFNRVYKVQKGNVDVFYVYDKDVITRSEAYLFGGLLYTEKYEYTDDNTLSKSIRTLEVLDEIIEEVNIYRYEAGNLVAFNDQVSEFDDKKNPFLNLFPKVFIQISDLPREYLSINNVVLTYDVSRDKDSATPYKEQAYNEQNFLTFKVLSEESCLNAIEKDISLCLNDPDGIIFSSLKEVTAEYE